MKQKKQNRILAALLAVAMMFQMLPMMAFADEGAGSEGAPSDVTLMSTGKSYSDLKEAVKDAQDTDTIELGVGNYTLYTVDSEGRTKGKDLTFVGQGTDKTAWNIGALVPDPANFGTEYNGDYSFDGAKKVTFQNMTLRSGSADYLGFIRPDETVVEDCVINGKTFYWGYTSAMFKNTTFNAPNGDYAIWTYSSPEMTFDGCTFNTTGKAINLYADWAGNYDTTINLQNCTVNGASAKQALNINDSNKGTRKYIINISGNNKVEADLDKTTCSRVFGFGGKPGNDTGCTEVYVDGEPVWGKKEGVQKGELKTHKYSAGEAEHLVTRHEGNWNEKDGHYERDVTTTCSNCGYTTTNTEKGYKLAYELNGGVAAEGEEYVYADKIVAENKTETLAAAPAREGFYFLGWKDENDKQYNADATITLTANTTLTAQWGDVPPVEPDTPAGGGSGDGGAGAVVAGALLGGAGYLLGTRLWLEGTFGFVPANRIELAMALWKRADCPAPVSTELYPDIDEDDTDAQAAARWCVEQDLMKDFARTNSDGTQTVKFKPYGYVFRPQSLVKWYKLEKLLNEQQSTNA